jgi:hypothetical protein
MRLLNVFLLALGAALLNVLPAVGQEMEPSKLWEVGDMAVYNWTLYSKTAKVEEEVVAVSDTEVTMVERMGDSKFDRVYDARQKRYTKYACLNSMVQCTFTPGNNWADWPLEKGKKWSNPTHVQGPTFEADLTKDHVVEGYEKVKVPAGEFAAYKISFTGKVKGRDSKGKGFSASEKGTYWYTVLKGKAIMVKFVYQNTFPEKVTKELLMVNYK